MTCNTKAVGELLPQPATKTEEVNFKQSLNCGYRTISLVATTSENRDSECQQACNESYQLRTG